jgi:Cys-tRNA(Pro)/Cys-tRNA(Cys) deacylase
VTPAIALLIKKKIPHEVHEYHHDKTVKSYGDEAAEKLNVSPDRVFKTLVFSADNDLAVGIVQVSSQLDLKKAAKALKIKKCQMAGIAKVESTTGYIAGGVSPLAQKKQLKTLVDLSAQNFSTIFVSAGKRGVEIELSPKDLSDLTNGSFCSISR